VASYRKALRAACRIWGVDDDPEPGSTMMQHLARVGSAAATLSRGYNQPTPQPPYDDADARAAYVLRYFTPYRRMAESILGDLGRARLLGGSPALDVCVLGMGPGPEIAALRSHLEYRHREVTTLRIQAIDRHADAWKQWFTALLDEPESSRGPSLTARHMKADLADGAWIHELDSNECRVVLAMNMLNEFGSSWPKAREHFVDLVTGLQQGAVVIVGDQYRSQQAVGHLSNLGEHLDDLLEWHRHPNDPAKDWAAHDQLNGIPEAMWTSGFFSPDRRPRTLLPTKYIAGVRR